VPKIVLNDLNLRSLKPPPKGQIDYWDSSFREGAFALRISQGGAKTFVLKLDNARRAIGRYPVITLSEARTEAKKILAERTLGRVRPGSISFATAKELFLAEKKKTRRPRTHHNLKQRLDLHFKFSGQLADFTHPELVRKLGKIKSTSEHDHALSAAKTFFTWCQNRRYIEDSPCRGLSPHGHTSRARVLSDQELKLIWQACEQRTVLSPDLPSISASTENLERERERCALPASYCKIVQLLILTGQRKSETASLRGIYYSHNQQTLCLPDTLTKNKREHIFPIGPIASNLLSKLWTNNKASLLFPARGKPDKHFNGWSKAKVALDKESGVTGWTLHDLRRTYRTIHARIKTAPHIAERLVNHISSRTAMEVTYDRHAYLDEMRFAVETYEQYLLHFIAD
jgi:integrase